MNDQIIAVLTACCDAGLSLAETGEELDNAHIRPRDAKRLSPESVRKLLPPLPGGAEYEVVKYWRPEQVKRAIAQAGLERVNRREVSWLSKQKRARMDAVLEEIP